MENSSVKQCDCKGKRSCLLCEGLLNRKARDLYSEFKVNIFFRDFHKVHSLKK